MIRFVILLLTIAYCCTIISATQVQLDLHNATTYKIIYNQFQNFSDKLTRVNFPIPGIGENCNKQLWAYANGLNFASEEGVQRWAVRMFDAMGKLEPGIMDGNLYSLGSYDECLSIQNEMTTYKDELLQVSGKYCVATFGEITTKMLNQPRSNPVTEIGSLSIGSCIPNACSADDMNILSYTIKFPLWYADMTCQIYDDPVELSGGDIAVIVFLSLIAGIAIISTICDLYLRSVSEKKPSSIYLAFSLVSNGEKLFATTTNSDQLECLSGIRTLSMMWIILSHMFSLITARPLTNLFYMYQFYSDGWTMYIRGATVSVDSFFLMSGIVLIYVYMKTIKNNTNLKFNIFSYYLHRYLRLTPALIVLILVHITLMRHFGTGPLWPYIEPAAVNFCKDNWWVNLLYLQNYVHHNEICLGQTWYLAVDTQLFLLSPLILIPLRRWKKQTLGMVAVLTCASMASSFAVAWNYELRDTNAMIGTVTPEMSLDYMYYVYSAPYARAAPWLIGILVGYFLYKVKIEKTKFKLNPVHNIVMWICALAVLCTCVFYDNAQDEYDRTKISFYIAFVRPAWAIALAWVIVACVTGHGGIVNWFLSLPIFQILGRLTYSLYLVHLTVILSVYLSQKTTIVLSNVAMMYEFWSMYAVCVGMAIIWTLLFESPIIIIEKSLKSKSK